LNYPPPAPRLAKALPYSWGRAGAEDWTLSTGD